MSNKYLITRSVAATEPKGESEKGVKPICHVPASRERAKRPYFGERERGGEREREGEIERDVLV